MASKDQELSLVQVVQWGVRNVSHNPSQGVSLQLKGELQGKKVYFSTLHPWLFEQARQLAGIETEEFRKSVGTENNLSGGAKAATSKSGSKFWKTADQRFVVKGISEQEANCVKRITEAYIEHLKGHPRCLINRILAAYHTKISGKGSYFIVMINVFHPDDQVLSVYDLKGTTENRLVDQKKLETSNVGKDLNFKDMTISLKSNEAAEELRSSIEQDSQFLCSHHVIDYSLLVGITQPSATNPSHWEGVGGIKNIPNDIGYRISIIDVLQPYTWNKRGANCFKSLTLKCCHEIDTEPPSYYSKRFVRYVQGKTTAASPAS